MPHWWTRSYTPRAQLHGRRCLDLVDSAGLVFQGWFHNTPYYPHDLFAPPSQFHPAANALPENKLWSVMERVQTLKRSPFLYGMPPRPAEEGYTIDFRRFRSSTTSRCCAHVAGAPGSEIFWPGSRSGPGRLSCLCSARRRPSHDPRDPERLAHRAICPGPTRVT